MLYHCCYNFCSCDLTMENRPIPKKTQKKGVIGRRLTTLPEKGLVLNLTETWHSEVGQKIGLPIHSDISFCIIIKHLLGGSKFYCGPTDYSTPFCFFFVRCILLGSVLYTKKRQKNKKKISTFVFKEHCMLLNLLPLPFFFFF